MIGTINGRYGETAIAGRRRFTFDGTVKGLTEAAVAAGVKLGTTIRVPAWSATFILDSAPGDARVDEVWAFRRRV